MAARSVKFIAALSIFMGFSIPAASAHTSVVATVPTYKSTLTAMPREISIEFTDPLMAIGTKKINTITIAHPDGSELEISETIIEKNIIKAELPDANYIDGTYTVSYRVVSADGHSISGSYELYLNTPSKQVASSTIIVERESFFHIHQGHFIQGGFALIVISLWWGYRRFNSEDGQ